MTGKYQNLQSQFLKIIVTVYLLTSIFSFVMIYFTLNNKIEDLGTTFSIQFLLKEKGNISSPIEREIALAKKMADTAIIKEWTTNEKDIFLEKLAMAELESYRQHFQDKSYFFIVNESLNYYFNDSDDKKVDDYYVYTLDKDEPEDQWYFRTMEQVDDFVLNVNVDRVLDTTKVWINAIVYDNQGEKSGLAGTGLTLDAFIGDFIKSGSSYITPILFDQNGYIQAYEDEEYIKLAAITSDEGEEEKTVFDLLGAAQVQEVKSIMDELEQSDDEVHTLQVSFGQENRIAAISYIPNIDWYIMVLIDTSEIFSVWDFTPIMSILIISLLVISLVIMYFIRQVIVRPVQDLTTFTVEMAAKKYEKRTTLKAANELGLLADSFNKMAETIHQHTNNLEGLVSQRTEALLATNRELEIKNQNILDNISYAKYLQQAILPEKEKLESHFSAHFILWRPRDMVGGDFYWFKEDQGDLLIAVIDCTGHGVPGALMTMTANAVLNRIVDTEELKKPSEILKRYDEVLKESLRKDKDSFQRDDGLDISLCVINNKAGKLTFSGANMDLYYAEKGQVIHIKGDRNSIGYQRIIKEKEFTDHEINFEGKTFYLTSDGFLDQNSRGSNQRFTRKAFMELLEKNLDHTLEKQGQIIKRTLLDFMGEEKQRDDISVIGFMKSRE